MKKFVWDTSAIINIKEPNTQGYSPAASLLTDLTQGWISGPHLNVFPTLAVFEVSATVSRKIREGRPILREFYLLDEHAVLYDLDAGLIERSHNLFATPGFDQLRGSDLVFAAIASVEHGILVTMDTGFAKHVGQSIDVLDLNDSITEPVYRERFRERSLSG